MKRTILNRNILKVHELQYLCSKRNCAIISHETCRTCRIHFWMLFLQLNIHWHFSISRFGAKCKQNIWQIPCYTVNSVLWLVFCVFQRIGNHRALLRPELECFFIHLQKYLFLDPQLLQELCTVFNVDLPCRVKSSQLGIISNKQSSTSAIVKPQPSSCSYICQHCLVHLGDIGELTQDILLFCS